MTTSVTREPRPSSGRCWSHAVWSRIRLVKSVWGPYLSASVQWRSLWLRTGIDDALALRQAAKRRGVGREVVLELEDPATALLRPGCDCLWPAPRRAYLRERRAEPDLADPDAGTDQRVTLGRAVSRGDERRGQRIQASQRTHPSRPGRIDILDGAEAASVSEPLGEGRRASVLARPTRARRRRSRL